MVMESEKDKELNKKIKSASNSKGHSPLRERVLDQTVVEGEKQAFADFLRFYGGANDSAANSPSPTSTKGDRSVASPQRITKPPEKSFLLNCPSPISESNPELVASNSVAVDIGIKKTKVRIEDIGSYFDLVVSQKEPVWKNEEDETLGYHRIVSAEKIEWRSNLKSNF